jgi:hypothetical protein
MFGKCSQSGAYPAGKIDDRKRMSPGKCFGNCISHFAVTRARIIGFAQT